MTIPTSSSIARAGVHVPPILPEQVAELRRSWQLVARMADEAAQLFYTRLFELEPSLRTLFHAEPAEQRRKLMDALSFIVARADRPDELQPMLAALGERHVRYGVRPEHYVTVGEALLWTLDQGLGALRTTESRDAWVAAYEFVATAMRAVPVAHGREAQDALQPHRAPSGMRVSFSSWCSRAVRVRVEPVPVVRKLAIQEAMHRSSGCGNLPAIFMAVALFAIDPNEFGLRTFRSELGGDPLTLRHVHVVIACAVYGEKRDIRPRKRHRRDVAKLGIGPGRRMAHHGR
jgi:hemoglobin-like flavoprotein